VDGVQLSQIDDKKTGRAKSPAGWCPFQGID